MSCSVIGHTALMNHSLHLQAYIASEPFSSKPSKHKPYSNLLLIFFFSIPIHQTTFNSNMCETAPLQALCPCTAGDGCVCRDLGTVTFEGRTSHFKGQPQPGPRPCSIQLSMGCVVANPDCHSPPPADGTAYYVLAGLKCAKCFAECPSAT